MKDTYRNFTEQECNNELITAIREASSNLDDVIERCVANSREKSLALTHLETANMWAIKALMLGHIRDGQE